MKRIVARLGLILPLALALGQIGSNAAQATTVGADGLAIVGSGTISPGLTTTPTFQSVTFSSIVGVGGGVAVSDAPNAGAAGVLVSCTFTGATDPATSPTGETVISGTGKATGNCNTTPLAGTINCVNITYSRVGAVVVIQALNACGASVNGVLGPMNFSAAGTNGAGVFVFIPTSANPTTSYLLAGGAAGAGTN